MPVSIRPHPFLSLRSPHWQLQWAGYPWLDDMVAMLTDKNFGLPGLSAQSGAAHAELSLGEGTLRLETVPKE
jgi:hypothetical protein